LIATLALLIAGAALLLPQTATAGRFCGKFKEPGLLTKVQVYANRYFECDQAVRDEAPDAKAVRELRERREKFRRACIAALHETEPLGRDSLIKEARDRGAEGQSDRLRNWLSELAADPTSGFISSSEGYQLNP
jgi:hypothetical protein